MRQASDRYYPLEGSGVVCHDPASQNTLYEVDEMYTQDKVCRITLRLNEEQFNSVKGTADILGVSPSEFLRMVVNSSMAMEKKASQALSEVTKKMEGLGRENDKTNINNIV